VPGGFRKTPGEANSATNRISEGFPSFQKLPATAPNLHSQQKTLSPSWFPAVLAAKLQLRDGRRPRSTAPPSRRNVMEALLGFSIDFWDYLTFLSLFFIVSMGLGFVVFMLGLPGRIAIARNHPEAEAVYLMGWVGFLAVVPWVQALAWAFRPTAVIDVRYLPQERRLETDAMIAKMTGKELPAIERAETQPGDTPS
jgi:uncharacterized protein DUF3302